MMNDTFDLNFHELIASTNPFFTLFRTEKEATTNRGTKEVELKFEWDEITQIFNELVSDLEHYENRFGMDSEGFYNAFQSGEIDEEREEFYIWRSKYVAYQHMNRRFGLTR